MWVRFPCAPPYPGIAEAGLAPRLGRGDGGSNPFARTRNSMFDFYKPPVEKRYTAILGPFKVEYIAVDITQRAPKVCIVDTMISSADHYSLTPSGTCARMRHGGLFLVGKKIIFATRDKGTALLTVIGH